MTNYDLEDFTLPDEFILKCAKDHDQAEKELYRKFIELLTTLQNLKMPAQHSKIILQKIKDARQFLVLNKNNLRDGYLIDEVGMRLYKYSTEIYDRDADKFFREYKQSLGNEIKENAEVGDVIEMIANIYKKLSKDEIAAVFKCLTHIVEIVGATTIKV
jgi:hypothetical protein